MSRESMPIVKGWADELRSVFGAEEMNSTWRKQGFFAQESGVTAGKPFPPDRGIAVSVSQMVLGPAPVVDRQKK